MLLILSGASTSQDPLLDITSKNHMDYAAKWDALYRRESFQEGEQAWPKLPAIIKALLEGHDVLWVDSDAVFSNLEKDPGDLFRKDINMFYDINGPCAGVMAIDGTKTSLRFFSSCLRNRPLFEGHQWSDQAAIRELMVHEPYRSRIALLGWIPLPYWLYDDLHPAVWDDIKWCHGDHILHAPGLTLEKRIELLTPFCV